MNSEDVTAVLEGNELWMQLDSLQNEMVVGPQGRRMFPNFNIRLNGLSPMLYYHIFMIARPIDDRKFSYDQRTQRWNDAGPADEESSCIVYYHPDTPCQGSGWMRKPISFKTPKFTTSKREGNMIVVRKGQKYVLVLHIVELNDEPSEPNKCLDLVFDETKFVTVNCHQNQAVSACKMNRTGRTPLNER